MTKTFFARIFTVLSVALLAACGGDGEGMSLPATATEVKFAFDRAPVIFENYFFEVATYGRASDPDTVMEWHQTSDKDPYRLVIRYKGSTIYDKTLWAIYQIHGTTTDGTNLIIVTEYPSPGGISGESVVFLNGAKVPVLQSLPVDFGQYGHFPAAVREIREYREGWLIIFATLRSRGDYYVNRWAMYHPVTREFIDCGELDSNRDSSWGPSSSSTCVRR